MYHRQQFPLWPMWGNGLGKSFFLVVTLSSGQLERFALRGIHSFEVHSCEQFRKWFVLEVVVGQSFPLGNGPKIHSPGKTYSIQVSILLVTEEWPS
jgi:hypothetical protein